MNRELLALAAQLAAERAPFAIATVVRREAPTSAHAGDAAIIRPDGRFHGWVGGSCTRPTVVREALAALADGRPRLIALDPDPAAVRPDGVTVLPMTCQSRGRVDVYIEPMLPTPVLYVFGVTPTARALCRLGAAMGWDVSAVDPDADAETFPEAAETLGGLAGDRAEADRATRGARRTFAVVATQGQWDEEAASQALALAPDYLGVVASPRRYGDVRAHLERAGAAAEALARIANPAGLDIGARTAAEVAISILAEIVRKTDAGRTGDLVAREGVSGDRSLAERAAAERPPPPERPSGPPERGEAPPPPKPARAAPTRALPLAGAPVQEVDPVCGMSVVPGDGTPSAVHGERTYWFCCGHCRARFVENPEAYGAGMGV